MKLKAYGLIIFIIGLTFSLSFGQTYFVYQRVGFTGYLHKLKLDCICPECCQMYLVGTTGDFQEGLTMSPDGKLYACDYTNHIYQIDTLNGATTLIFSLPPQPKMLGLVTLGGGIFYSMLEINLNNADTLVEINTNTGVVTKLGVTPLSQDGDLTVYNGEIYYLHAYPNNLMVLYYGIVKLNISDPASSTLVAIYPFPYACVGITASKECQKVLATDFVGTRELVTISLVDGAVTHLCDLPFNTLSITSMEEFSTPVICNVFDLDCNDSSGATDADFNAPEVNCLSTQCTIADSDIDMVYDSKITEVTVHLTGALPDAPNEFLKYTGMIAAINVTGANTDMITLTNAGPATSTDFKNALHAIYYRNLATPFTAGPRSVEAQYTLESGVISELATAFISVVDLPILQVDLGPDQVLCEGEIDTLDAGYPGATYHWSNGLSTQTISTSQQGQLAVTVSTNGYCPGEDSVNLEFIPVINVSLDGPQGICFDNSATLIINTNSPFPLTIEIGSSTGSFFVLNNVINNFTFSDFPSAGTLYTILQVTPSSPACVEVQDSFQFVEVFPTYSTFQDTSMCEGDSLFIGNIWATAEGNYEYTYSTAAGCDSMVNTFILVWPTTHIATHSSTCDSSEAGVFVTFLNNPAGCDTVVTNTITLLSSDTTLISLLSCNMSGVSSFTQTFTSQSGCDSLVITTTSWIPPADTTFLNQTTCDSSLLGVFTQFLAAHDGCDSIVITTALMALSDTTYLSGISCDPASIGVFQNLLTNQMGCDSLVIITITAGMSDTTLIFKSSCDSSSLGTSETHYMTLQGCDSLVVTTVSYSAQDSTFISGSSCDPADVGVFVQLLTNGLGCDSIVTTTVALLPSNESFISSTTCDPSSAGNFDYFLINQFGCDSILHETISLLATSATFLSTNTCSSSQAGTFVTTLQNQYGCDSIVTLTVSLIPADTTLLFFKTCDPAQVGSVQSSFTNQNGCDSLVIQQTRLYPLPNLTVEASSDFNGFGISCFGESDGSAIANVTGIGPYQYLWSTGSPDQNITGLSAGDYLVTITDGNGCFTTGTVSIIQPEEFSIELVVAQPDCFDHQEGSISVMQNGGILPIRYSIDGINYQTSSLFNDLPDGTYTITALDANECETKEIIWINVPLAVNVDLGDDRTILPGDSTVIEAIVSIPFDSLAHILWSGLTNPNCPNCLLQPIAPIITSAYSISVTNTQGCSDADSVIVYIEHNIDIYVPNIFSPNGDNINDRLLISARPEVEDIESFIIFDRWGNVVYHADHFPPNDLAYSWDGNLNGIALNPAVFAYKIMVRFRDGRKELRNGDITLIR